VRKKLLRLCEKINLRVCAMYTWLLRSSLKSCGPEVRLHFPVRFGKPESISLGTGCMIYPRAWISAVTAWWAIRTMEKSGSAIEWESATRFKSRRHDQSLSRTMCRSPGSGHCGSHPRLPAFGRVDSWGAMIDAAARSHRERPSWGAHCMIGPGVRIGEHSIVTANSVVVNDGPAFSMAAVNPARVARFRS